MGDEIEAPKKLSGAVAWGGLLSGLLYIGATLTLLVAVSQKMTYLRRPAQASCKAIGHMDSETRRDDELGDVLGCALPSQWISASMAEAAWRCSARIPLSPDPRRSQVPAKYVTHRAHVHAQFACGDRLAPMPCRTLMSFLLTATRRVRVAPM